MHPLGSIYISSSPKNESDNCTSVCAAVKPSRRNWGHLGVSYIHTSSRLTTIKYQNDPCSYRYNCASTRDLIVATPDDVTLRFIRTGDSSYPEWLTKKATLKTPPPFEIIP